MTHYELNNCTNLLNIIDIMNSFTGTPNVCGQDTEYQIESETQKNVISWSAAFLINVSLITS